MELTSEQQKAIACVIKLAVDKGDRPTETVLTDLLLNSTGSTYGTPQLDECVGYYWIGDDSRALDFLHRHRRDLMNACKNIYIGAWLLKRKINQHGNNAVAIGAYHSETPRERDLYALLIRRQIKKIQLAGLD
jgi:hypothetical protein